MGKHHKKPDIDGMVEQLFKQHDDMLSELLSQTRPFDSLAVYRLMEKLACVRPVCVGYVNDTGWHLDCQSRAREAMLILGIDLPPQEFWKDPVPDEDKVGR